MYNINNSNPFGEWTGYKTLNENATPQQIKNYNRIFNEVCTGDISEQEVADYMQKLLESDKVLNEYALNEFEERAWWGVSPFEWTKGLRIGGIFKPLKWLALPLLGGVVLLLAGIYKLLKEGKKQIAIARIRAWIEKLVVLADSGYKKTRKNKDSLFLIRQRYRRDILQSAVKIASSLGIDIEEKDTKPESVETSLNESENNGIVDNDIFIVQIVGNKGEDEDKDLYFSYNHRQFRFTVDIKGNRISELIEFDNKHKVEGKPVNESDEDINSIKNIFESSIKKCGNLKDFMNTIRAGYRINPDGSILDRDYQNISTQDLNGGQTSDLNNDGGQTGNLKGDDTQVPTNKDGDTQNLGLNNDGGQTGDLKGDGTQVPGNKDGDTQNLGGDTQIPGNKSNETGNLGGDDTQVPGNNDGNIQGQGDKPGDKGNDHIIKEGSILPDDSRVDWSLMNSITASSWFGLKHKTTNFWKEAKSVSDITQGNQDPARVCAMIIAHASSSLNLIATQAVAQNYVKVLQKYVNTFNGVNIQQDKYVEGSNRYDNRFKSNESYKSHEDQKLYEMFKDDIHIYEAINNTQPNLEYDRLIDQAAKNLQSVKNINIDNLNTQEKANLINLDVMKNMEAIKKIALSSRNGEDNTPVDNSNIEKYLSGALCNALASSNFSEWQMYRNAYDQMIKFINELTKMVNTVIDSVAKKADERMSNGSGFEAIILKFISSKGDPKQNTSLKTLWQNMGVSKLQQRTIVHCDEIVASPEMQYYLDMFLITIPSMIKRLKTNDPEAVVTLEETDVNSLDDKRSSNNDSSLNDTSTSDDNIDIEDASTGDTSIGDPSVNNIEDSSSNTEDTSTNIEDSSVNDASTGESHEEIRKKAQDALSSLVALGYDKNISGQVVADIINKHPEWNTSQIVTAALHWDR